MLQNGLGQLLSEAVPKSGRVFDLFTGSGAVAWHVSKSFSKSVVAVDLQQYAVALASAVIERDAPIKDFDWIEDWALRAESRQCKNFRNVADRLQDTIGTAKPQLLAENARKMCADTEGNGLIFAYGGYYFSPQQVLWLSTLRASLPNEEAKRSVALAALIRAASKCAASPGHTAQPFKPNETAGKFLLQAWQKDLKKLAIDEARELCGVHGRIKGSSIRMDANDATGMLEENDLAFLDPPYSGVHYSRFYHVLETVAKGTIGNVSGTGRYPHTDERPKSDYSIRTRAKAAFSSLLGSLSERGANVIITFPAGSASNGLSGDDVLEISDRVFKVAERKVSSRFSTLGGNLTKRAARTDSTELLLSLIPK